MIWDLNLKNLKEQFMYNSVYYVYVLLSWLIIATQYKFWSSSWKFDLHGFSGECGVWLDFSDLHAKKSLLQRTEVYLCRWLWECEYFSFLFFSSLCRHPALYSIWCLLLHVLVSHLLNLVDPGDLKDSSSNTFNQHSDNLICTNAQLMHFFFFFFGLLVVQWCSIEAMISWPEDLLGAHWHMFNISIFITPAECFLLSWIN